jgi:sulfofructose kinase
MTKIVCLGIVVKDIIFYVDQIPSVPQKMTAHSIDIKFGGMAATAAAAAAALGGEVEFWGRIGDDQIGQEVINAFKERGVVSRIQITQNTQTALSAVVVDGKGERFLAAYPGRFDTSAEWLNLNHLNGVKAVLADFRWLEGAKKLFSAATNLGIPRVLDADTGDITALKELIPLANHVIFSERGLMLFTEGLDPASGLIFASQYTKGIVAVTLGAVGSLFYVDGELHPIAGFKVNVIDTNGAGDVFHGAYTLALSKGLNWENAAKYANIAAALKCSKSSGWQILPTNHEVLNFLGEKR